MTADGATFAVTIGFVPDALACPDADPGRADDLVAAVLERGSNIRRTSADDVGCSFDETTTPAMKSRIPRARGLIR